MTVKPSGPWGLAEALIPNNTVALSNVTMALHAQSTGTLNVRFVGANTLNTASHVVLNVVVGNTYRYQISHLYEGSTANVISLR